MNVSMNWIDKMLGMDNNLMIVDPIVDSRNVCISCPGIGDDNCSWQKVIGKKTFQCRCVTTGNDLKLAFSRSAFNQSDHPTSAPVSTAVVYSVEKIHFINLHIHRHAIPIKTAQIEIELLPGWL